MPYHGMLRRLKTYKFASPTELWNTAHLKRRAGVLVVLTPSANDLNVLLTVRTQHLSYAGDAALPGGKADSVHESPLDVALRESHEEVDLDTSGLEFLGYMPPYVSSKLLMVVPSLVWSPTPAFAHAKSTEEVSKVFRMPLSQFLQSEGHSFRQGRLSGSLPFKVSYFNILAQNKKIGDPVYDRVWGLTAGILIDCARVAFEKAPQFEPGDWRPNKSGMEILENMAKEGILQRDYKNR